LKAIWTGATKNLRIVRKDENCRNRLPVFVSALQKQPLSNFAAVIQKMRGVVKNGQITCGARARIAHPLMGEARRQSIRQQNLEWG